MTAAPHERPNQRCPRTALRSLKLPRPPESPRTQRIAGTRATTRACSLVNTSIAAVQQQLLRAGCGHARFSGERRGMCYGC